MDLSPMSPAPWRSRGLLQTEGLQGHQVRPGEGPSAGQPDCCSLRERVAVRNENLHREK